LDLLGFIRPTRDFSTGYGGSKQKIPVLLFPCRGGVSRDAGFDPASSEKITRILISAKTIRVFLFAFPAALARERRSVGREMTEAKTYHRLARGDGEPVT